MGRNQSQAAEQGMGSPAPCGIASMLCRRTRVHRLGNWSCPFAFFAFFSGAVLDVGAQSEMPRLTCVINQLCTMSGGLTSERAIQDAVSSEL